MAVPLVAGSVVLGIGYVISKIIVAFGIGIVTYTALTTGIDAVEAILVANTGAFVADSLQIINLAGVLEGMSIILAALTTRASIVFVSKLAFGMTPA